MKKLFVIIVAFISLISASRVKTGGYLTYRVSKIKDLKTDIISYFFYTPDGKISSATNSNGGRLVYYYNGNVVIKNLGDTHSNQYVSDTIFLNKRGLAYRVAQNVTCGSISNNYRYSKDRFLTRDETYDKDDLQNIKTWSIADSCPRSMTFFRDSKARNTTYYYYYPETYNTIGDENMGRGFLGKSAVHLLKESYTIAITGDTTMHLLYKYAFDQHNRVALKVVRDIYGTLEDSAAYYY